MSRPSEATTNRTRSSSFYWIVAFLSITISVALYAFLIGSNCESTGLASFIRDVGDFHTSEGC